MSSTQDFEKDHHLSIPIRAAMKIELPEGDSGMWKTQTIRVEDYIKKLENLAASSPQAKGEDGPTVVERFNKYCTSDPLVLEFTFEYYPSLGKKNGGGCLPRSVLISAVREMLTKAGCLGWDDKSSWKCPLCEEICVEGLGEDGTMLNIALHYIRKHNCTLK